MIPGIPPAVGVVSRDEQGARFLHEDGSERYMVGPAAIALANRIGARENPAGGGNAPASVPTTYRMTEGGFAPARSGVTTSWEPAVPTGAGTPPPGPYPAPAAPAGTPRLEGAPATQQEPMDPLRQQLYQSAARYIQRGPYTPGVNPQRMVQTGMMVPATGATSREGGLPTETAEQLAAMRGQMTSASIEEQQAIAAARDQWLVQQQMAAGRAMEQLEQQRAIQEAKNAAMRRAYNDKMSTLESQIQAASSREVDPDRVFTSKGTWSSIMGVIGIALGGYLQGKGMPNPAWQIIQKRVDQDIRAQEQAIANGVNASNLALGRFREQYNGDMDLAKAALAATMERMAGAQAQYMATQQKRFDVAQGMADWMAKTRDQSWDAMRDFEVLARGKVTEQVGSKWVVPQSGGYGGPGAWTPERAAAMSEALGKIPGAGLPYTEAVEGAKARGKAIGAPAGETPEDVAKRADEYLSFKKENAAAQAAIDTWARTMGAVRKEDGTWGAPRGISGAGPVLSRVPATAKSRQVQQLRDNVLARYRKTMTGLAGPESEMKRIEKTLRGPIGTEQEVLTGLNIAQELIAADEKAIGEKAGATGLQIAKQRATGAQQWRAGQPKQGEEIW